MAAQPDEDALPIFVTRDERQPWLEDDFDKIQIEDVPEDLDKYFDKAVEFARKYVGSRDTRVAIIKSIEGYLDQYTQESFENAANLVRPDRIPRQQWVDIQALVKNVDMYYYMTLEDNTECREEVTKILSGYCDKVVNIGTGCLVATLRFLVNDHKLACLITNFMIIAQKIRIVVVNILKSIANKYEKENEISEELKAFTLEVLSKISDRMRIQISLEQKRMFEMVKTLKSERSAELELTMMTKMSGLTLPSSSDPDDVEGGNQRADFIDKFKDFELTYKALAEIFLSKEDYERLTDDMEQLAMERKGEKEEKEVEWEDTEELKKLSFDGSLEPKVYRGALSPPSSGYATAGASGTERDQRATLSDTNIYIGNPPQDMTERDLFEKCREYGTILNLRIIEDRATKWHSGFVDFAEAGSVEKAIEGLANYNTSKARKGNNAPILSENTLIMRDLSSHTSKHELTEISAGFGELRMDGCTMIPPSSQRPYIRGRVEFMLAENAREALKDFQKRNQFVLMEDVFKEKEEALEEEMVSYEESDTTICILHPPKEANERYLFNICREFGTILNVAVAADRSPYMCKRGYVQFEKPSQAENAIAGLTDWKAKKAKSETTPIMSTTALLFKDLPKGITVHDLAEKCRRYKSSYRVHVLPSLPHTEFDIGFANFTLAEVARQALVDFQTNGEFVIMAREQSYS